jgi:peptide/nickel transport system permease protein
LGKKEFIIRRALSATFIIFATMTILFFLFRMVPGGPEAVYLDPTFSAEQTQKIIERFGLDKPLHIQYFNYLKSVFQGDFGRSFHYRVPSFKVLQFKIWNTLILSATSFVVAYSFGLAMGVLLTRYRGKVFDRLTMVGAFIVRSMPQFWVGMVAIMIFSFSLGWFPPSGMHTPGSMLDTFFDKYMSIDFIRHLVLPVLVSSLYYFSFPMLVLRNSMLEIQGEDFIEIAKAKGLSTNQVLLRHVMRNAMLPIVTIMSVYVGMAISGSAALEYVFSWPGLGNELLQSLARADYPVAQAAFLLLSFTMTIMNFVADILYGYLDPRVVYR